MRSPFPGMDPYLEAPERWRNVVARLITYTADALQPQLLPGYAALIEERVELGSTNGHRWPDVAVRERSPRSAGQTAVAVRPLQMEVTDPELIEAPERTAPPRFIAIRELEDQRLVTAIEVLSPWNKVGLGLSDYQRKQTEYLFSPVNLIEIDLLRRGRHTIAAPRDRTTRSDYRVCVHRALSVQYGVISFGLRHALPVVGVPLEGDDPDVVLDLPSVLGAVYDRGAFAYITDYSGEPDPPLRPEDREWARELIEAWREAQRAGDSPAV